jgi:hypothetical protein
MPALPLFLNGNTNGWSKPSVRLVSVVGALYTTTTAEKKKQKCNALSSHVQLLFFVQSLQRMIWALVG